MAYEEDVRLGLANMVSLRLLTWQGPEGKRLYLSSDGGSRSMMTDFADAVEKTQTETAEHVLAFTRTLLTDPKTDIETLRSALKLTREALAAVLLVAESRGERLPAPDVDEDLDEDQAEEDEEDDETEEPGDSDPRLTAESR